MYAEREKWILGSLEPGNHALKQEQFLHFGFWESGLKHCEYLYRTREVNLASSNCKFLIPRQPCHLGIISLNVLEDPPRISVILFPIKTL
jgi:hypothetical protein